jgi:hypothetical protein
MPTITLTITDEQLARLKAGETTFTLTATLREKKPKTATPLPEHLRDAYTTVVELWAKYQPDVSPALAWKTVKPLLESAEDMSRVLDAMAMCLDWNEGRKVMPTWFVKDYGPIWEDRVGTDMFTEEEARHAYRKRFGLS